jgi:hypothetical protein
MRVTTQPYALFSSPEGKETRAITSMTANVDSEKARLRLSGFARRFRLGRLLKVVAFYVPYETFEVTVGNDGKNELRHVAVDAVSGDLDLFDLDAAASTFEAVEDGFVVEKRLDTLRLARVVEEKTRTAVYKKGFFRIKDLSIGAAHLSTIHVPYWVGIFERRGEVRLDIICAVTNRFEGAKVNRIVTDWFNSGTPRTETRNSFGRRDS